MTKLSEQIQSLLTYANGVTGEEDATLGDAVRTLADGFGQGGGYTQLTGDDLQWLYNTFVRGDGSVASGTNLKRSNPVYLEEGECVFFYGGGTNIGWVSSCSETGEIISVLNASQIASILTIIISQSGYYCFSGRCNRTDGSNFVLSILKGIEITLK